MMDSNYIFYTSEISYANDAPNWIDYYYFCVRYFENKSKQMKRDKQIQQHPFSAALTNISYAKIF